MAVAESIFEAPDDCEVDGSPYSDSRVSIPVSVSAQTVRRRGRSPGVTQIERCSQKLALNQSHHWLGNHFCRSLDFGDEQVRNRRRARFTPSDSSWPDRRPSKGYTVCRTSRARRSGRKAFRRAPRSRPRSQARCRVEATSSIGASSRMLPSLINMMSVNRFSISSTWWVVIRIVRSSSK